MDRPTHIVRTGCNPNNSSADVDGFIPGTASRTDTPSHSIMILAHARESYSSASGKRTLWDVGCKRPMSRSIFSPLISWNFHEICSKPEHSPLKFYPCPGTYIPSIYRMEESVFQTEHSSVYGIIYGSLWYNIVLKFPEFSACVLVTHQSVTVCQPARLTRNRAEIHISRSVPSKFDLV